MINAIRSEWIKFRTVRSTLVLLAAAGGLVVLVAVIAALQKEQPHHMSELIVGVRLAAFLFGALGVQIIGQEYRFNTIRPTFTAEPRRRRVLGAKLVVVVSACAAMSALMLGVCALIGSVLIDGFTIDATDGRVMVGTVLFAICWSALGLGVGAIVRQPIAGIVLLLGEAFVAEQIGYGLIKAIRPWLPFFNGIQMTVAHPGEMSGLRGPLAGGCYFAVVTVIVLTVGLFLAERRDA
jgi:ABC-2 type transport system permease protein